MFFDAASGAVTITQSGARVAKSLTNTGFTGTFAGSGGLTVSGNLTLGSGATYTNTSTITINASCNFTFNGNTWAGLINVNGSGITTTLQDAMAFSGSGFLNLAQGTFDTNNFNYTAVALLAGGSSTRTLTLGSSTLTLTATGPWDSSGSNLTFNADTSTILLTAAAGSTVAFTSTGGKTFNNVRRTNAGQLTVGASPTINDLRLDGEGARLALTAGTTTTLTSLTMAGTALGAMRSIASVTPGATATLNKSSGSIDLDWLTLQDITFGGGATWTATDSIDVDNNSGITITPPSSGGGGLAAPLFGGGVI